MSPQRKVQAQLAIMQANGEGRQAYKDGVDFFDNPYAGTDLGRNWEDGWDDAYRASRSLVQSPPSGSPRTAGCVVSQRGDL